MAAMLVSLTNPPGIELYSYANVLKNMLIDHVRKQRSTETAIAYIVDTLLFNLDENKINGLVLVDYDQDFDMVGSCHFSQQAGNLQFW